MSPIVKTEVIARSFTVEVWNISWSICSQKISTTIAV